MMPMTHDNDIGNPRISFDAEDSVFSSTGHPSEYPSTPLASFGQLSKLSTTPSLSVSLSLGAQPNKSTDMR